MKRLLVLAILVAVAAPVAAQDDSGEQQPQRKNPFTMMVRFLELDEIQVEQWKALIEQRRAGATLLEEQARAIQEQLKAEFDTGSPDPTTVGELVIERRTIAENQVSLKRDYLETFRTEILNENQVQRLDFLRRADRVQPLIPAAKRLGLLPPRRGGQNGDPDDGDTASGASIGVPSLSSR
jgi:hypothetical protein